jgi:hypothetical protein
VIRLSRSSAIAGLIGGWAITVSSSSAFTVFLRLPPRPAIRRHALVSVFSSSIGSAARGCTTTHRAIATTGRTERWLRMQADDRICPGAVEQSARGNRVPGGRRSGSRSPAARRNRRPARKRPESILCSAPHSGLGHGRFPLERPGRRFTALLSTVAGRVSARGDWRLQSQQGGEDASRNMVVGRDGLDATVSAREDNSARLMIGSRLASPVPGGSRL